MRRRPEPAGDGTIPARLRRYNAADWPDGCHPECEFWEALIEWTRTHPDGPHPDDHGAPDAWFHPERV